jgi:GntR family transcriptional regulator / MocR family aminotransferase
VGGEAPAGSTGSPSRDNGPVDRSKDSPVRQTNAGADFLQLSRGRRPDSAPDLGLSAWLTAEIRSAVASGRLPVGARLPASRILAEELQVSRGVVTEAYQRLIELGQAEGRGRAGTVIVSASSTTDPPRNDETGPALGAPTAAPAIAREPGVEVFDNMRALEARIDLTPGVPDLSGFPRAAWLRTERAVLSDLSAPVFGYGDPRGAIELRRAVSDWLGRTRGIRVDPAEILIVSGVAQSLSLIARALVDEGIADVAVEDPGSLGARQLLQSWGLRTAPIAVDEHGVLVDQIEASGLPAALVTPAHQFPTGVVLDGRRRRSLLRWATAGGLIIEDDYDAEHRYDRPPVAALRSMLADRICYTGSVSKLLAPAVRIGWLLPPARYRDRLIDAKRNADLGNAVVPQLVLAELMSSGAMERHLRLLRRRHRERRDAMISALQTHVPTARVHGAAAGLHLTITFDPDLDDVDLARRLLEAGVKTQPLSWHRQQPGAHGLVLGYAATAPGDLADGIATLGRIVRGLG